MNVCHFSSTHFDAPYFSYLGKRIVEKGARQFFVTLNATELPKWIIGADQLVHSSIAVRHRVMYPIAILRLARFLRKNSIDVIQTHQFDAAIIGVLAAKLAKTPVKIVSRHHLDDAALTGTKLHVTLDKWTDAKADMVIVPSEATRRYMIEVEQQKDSNIRVVPYGFDFGMLDADDEDRRRVRSEFGLDDNFVIGCVGRFFPNKGHSYLFEAVGALVGEFPRLKILLLGDGDRKELEEQIVQNNIADHVVFAGFRSDVPACMKAMDLLVHPSLSESFGQVIVEAMCVGTPVVVTSVGGVPEIVENDKTGLVVAPKDSDALREAIQSLWKDRARRTRLAEAGAASAREKFSVDKFIERQWECYLELLNKI